MKLILGLDLGTTSIGWAVVLEAETPEEISEIIATGVRIVPLTVDEKTQFTKGDAIGTNVARRLKRSMRRNLQRYKLRRHSLIKALTENGIIAPGTTLGEDGPANTFRTYSNRAKAVSEPIGLDELARVLLMINKKRGYKSTRKVKESEQEGTLIDGMALAKKMHNEGLTPGQITLELLKTGKTKAPSFYRSDLIAEFERIWEVQSKYYDALTTSLKAEVIGKTARQTWAILAQNVSWASEDKIWNEELACSEIVTRNHTLQGIKRTTKGREQKLENYQWRVEALYRLIDFEHLAIVLQDINSQISSSSSYLGAISDRSKTLYFDDITVGQFLWDSIQQNPDNSLKRIVFYRQDYIDEFNRIWDTQAAFHPQLTPELKKYIRDRIIFYQRPLKSQKSRIAFCELEQKEITVEHNGKPVTKTIGRRVIPRSHPLFQEFRIWQTLNNLEVFYKDCRRKKSTKLYGGPSLFDGEVDALELKGHRPLDLEEKQILAEELSIKKALTKKEILKLLFRNHSELDLNYEKVDGNTTGHALYSAFSDMAEACCGADPIDFSQPAKVIKERLRDIFLGLGISTDILDLKLDGSNKQIEECEYHKLWHLLYSYEGDDTPTGYGKLLAILSEKYGIPEEGTTSLAMAVLEDDYGNLSAKAISKILPYLKEGNTYDVACAYAGYNHSRQSLTSEENMQRVLKPALELLPKDSLHNPVVEKILNQMVNVVNTVAERYGNDGHFDEIRVEMARELKKNAAQRKTDTAQIAQASKANQTIHEILANEFGIMHVSRNDIIRYKLYMELEPHGFKTLYSNKYISREQLFSKEIDIEHIIPQATLFDDSLSNKTLEFRAVNQLKGRKTAYDYVKDITDEAGLEEYINRCKNVYADKKVKLNKLLMTESEIPEDFIARDLKNTQYIAKKAMNMLRTVCRRVTPSIGSITEELRRRWQLVDVMKEINMPKYDALGMVETYTDRDGRTIRSIKDWSKRSDHRHHAMDAITVAFTRAAFVQFYNNRNAQYNANSSEYTSIIGIRQKYFPNDSPLPPMPLDKLRAQVRHHLENTLISFKAKNKVTTPSVNKIKTRSGIIERRENTPRGALHKETTYGLRKRYITKEEKIGASFDAAKIATVCSSTYRHALTERLLQFGSDPQKAFTGKNAPSKNPILIPGASGATVPEKVRTVTLEKYYSLRVPINKDIKIDKVLDAAVRNALKARLDAAGGNADKAFSNLDQDPIIVNGHAVKNVTIEAHVKEADPIHKKRDKTGRFILDPNGKEMRTDYMANSENHLVAIYRKCKYDNAGMPMLDESGEPIYEWAEQMVSFMEAVERRNQSLPIIDVDRYAQDGGELFLTLKKNEYVVLPDYDTDFIPSQIDLLDPANAAVISPHLFRVQKLASSDYVFRHHLETTVESTPALRGKAWERITALKKMKDVVKVRLDHSGVIVAANFK